MLSLSVCGVARVQTHVNVMFLTQFALMLAASQVSFGRLLYIWLRWVGIASMLKTCAWQDPELLYDMQSSVFTVLPRSEPPSHLPPWLSCKSTV